MSKNVIGIDFGTSTSLIRVKEYNGTNDDMTMACKAVTMSQDGQVNTPSLIRINGEQHTYGHNAIIGKGTLYSNFKILLRSADKEKRQLGVELTHDFYSYLFKQYDSQKNVLLKNSSEETVTKVSYPPQWDKEQRQIVLDAAKDAGFKNVEGVDEATASVNCILNCQGVELLKSGLIKYGKPFTILVIDMGAGTTDLAFVKVTAIEEIKTEILGTWPLAYSDKIYGGCRMDDRFAVFLKKWLTENGITISTAEKIISSQAPQIKMWKEQTVSAVLEADKSITECSVIENVLMMFGTEINPMPELNRTSFENIFASEIDAFADVVKSAPAELLGQTDIVVLTGGNSAWYWIPDVLCRTDIGLKKIIKDPWRVLKTALPNETVARGLVYPSVNLNSRKGRKYVPRIEPTCTSDGSIEYWQLEGDSSYYADEKSEKILSPEDIVLPALGHDFEVVDNQEEKKRVCKRCGCVDYTYGQISGDSPLIKDKFANIPYLKTLPPSDEANFEIYAIGDNCGIKKYIGKEEIIVVPNYIHGHAVVEIGDVAFGKQNNPLLYGKWNYFFPNERIKAIILPKSVTVIGKAAFRDCKKIKTVIAYPSVKKIDDYAFFGCNNLEYFDFNNGSCERGVIKFPEKLEELGVQAFNKIELTISSDVIPKEVWLNKKTKLHTSFGFGKAFSSNKCAMYYYK